MRFWRHRDDIERRLRSERPDARPEFVRALSDRVAPRPVATRRSLALAAVFTVLLLSMFAAAGGVSYAADAVSSTVSSAKSTLSGSSSSGTPTGGGGCYGPTCDQYAKKAKIIIKKKTIPSGDYTKFTFTGHPSGQLSDGQSTYEVVVAPGTYTSTELVPDGWKLTDIKCDDTDSTGNTGTKTATFKVVPNEVVTCTFTNTKKAKIKVWKKTVPAGAYDKFTFSGDLSGQIGDGEYIYKYVDPGTYYATEAAKDGWKLTDISCTDSDSTGRQDDREGHLQGVGRRVRDLLLHEHEEEQDHRQEEDGSLRARTTSSPSPVISLGRSPTVGRSGSTSTRARTTRPSPRRRAPGS